MSVLRTTSDPVDLASAFSGQMMIPYSYEELENSILTGRAGG